MLLQTKSVINCKDDIEEEIHNQEIKKFEELVMQLPNFNCYVEIKYIDIAHKNNLTKQISCQLHDFLTLIEYCDFKNGIDIYNKNDFITIKTYGQMYQIQDKWEYVQQQITIYPYRDKEIYNIFEMIEKRWKY